MSNTDLSELTVQLREILRTLARLPSDQVRQVRDFALFLEERYAAPATVDMIDSWSDEDIRDLLAASMAYAEQRWEDIDEACDAAG